MAAGLLLLASAAFASEIRVALDEGEKGAYHLKGEFAVKAGTAAIWEVLTDYDGIGSFVSSVESSRVLRRRPGAAVIEQEGSGRFLFFSRRVKLTLSVQETAPEKIDFKDIDGSQFERYEGSWRVLPSSSSFTVVYELTAQPDHALGPRFAAKKALRKQVRRQLEEVRAEIERRGSFHFREPNSPQGEF